MSRIKKIFFYKHFEIKAEIVSLTLRFFTQENKRSLSRKDSNKSVTELISGSWIPMHLMYYSG